MMRPHQHAIVLPATEMVVDGAAWRQVFRDPRSMRVRGQPGRAERIEGTNDPGVGQELRGGEAGAPCPATHLTMSSPSRRALGLLASMTSTLLASAPP
jgi:hypothetical protein